MNRSSRLRAATLGAASIAAVAAVSASASPAMAASCNGDAIHGRGSTLQNFAQQSIWSASAGFPSYCSGVGTPGAVTYNNIAGEPTGSGAGLNAMGAAGGSNGVSPLPSTGPGDTSVRFGGTDEPPTAAQIANMDSKSDASSANNRQVRQFPVAQAAISLIVHLPSTCTVSDSSHTITDSDGRLRIENDKLEHFFAGLDDADTWGELVGTTDTSKLSCANTAVTRVVRSDTSGTTFQFRKFLQHFSGTTWAGTGSGTDWDAQANTVWPNSSTHPTITGNGSGGVVSAVDANANTIGYVALPNARAIFNYAGTSDKEYWLQISQRQLDEGTGTVSTIRVDPSTNPTSTSAGRSNCTDGDRERRYVNVPADDATLGDWTQTSSVKSEDESSSDPLDFYTPNEYAICALTYDLAWTDYSDAYTYTGSPFTLTAGQVTNVKDYLEYILDKSANGGQADITAGDYDRLPDDIDTPELQGHVADIHE